MWGRPGCYFSWEGSTLSSLNTQGVLAHSGEPQDHLLDLVGPGTAQLPGSCLPKAVYGPSVSSPPTPCLFPPSLPVFLPPFLSLPPTA